MGQQQRGNTSRPEGQKNKRKAPMLYACFHNGVFHGLIFCRCQDQCVSASYRAPGPHPSLARVQSTPLVKKDVAGVPKPAMIRVSLPSGSVLELE